jgi:hypothetical protein
MLSVDYPGGRTATNEFFHCPYDTFLTAVKTPPTA